MALKPTIFKLSIALSNIDRHYYDQLNITVAQHPSETVERMLVRVLAYCLNMPSELNFTAGLSTPNEPDIAEVALNGVMQHWLDVGEPNVERIKKASRLAQKVSVYSFNRKSDTWWQQESTLFGQLPVNVNQFDSELVQHFATMAERTMELSMTISENTLFVTTATGDVEIPCVSLQKIEG